VAPRLKTSVRKMDAYKIPRGSSDLACYLVNVSLIRDDVFPVNFEGDFAEKAHGCCTS
jgi:hypothetical protein